MKEKIWQIYCSGYEHGQADILLDNADSFTMPNREDFERLYGIEFLDDIEEQQETFKPTQAYFDLLNDSDKLIYGEDEE